MENLKVKGQIEVILEDEHGNVKYREIKDNTVTDGFLRWWMANLMNNTSLNTVSRSTNNGALLFNGQMEAPGIYLMSTPVDIKPETFITPYSQLNRSTPSPDITFYNQNGATTETSSVIIPNQSCCGFINDGSNITYSIEYIKNSYSGEIRSVTIGNGISGYGSGAVNQGWYSIVKDVKLPVDFYQSGLDWSNYLLEHTPEGTLFYQRFTGSVNPFVVNMKTKDIKYYGSYATGTAINSNINNSTYVGGLIVNNTVWKAIRGTVSGSTYNIDLQAIKNWTSATTGATAITIPVTVKSGMSLYTGQGQPVMVAIPGENKLEIFVTTSVGNDNGVIGANVQKAVVDVSNTGSITYTIEEVGTIPYIIGTYSTDKQRYNTGLFYNDQYWLPYYGIVDSTTGSAVNTSGDYYSEGGIFDSEMNLIKQYAVRAGLTNMFNTNPIIAEDVRPFVCAHNSTTSCRGYFFFSSIVSGTNLDQSIVKEQDDILRVIYRYTLA